MTALPSIRFRLQRLSTQPILKIYIALAGARKWWKYNVIKAPGSRQARYRVVNGEAVRFAGGR